MNPNNCQSCGMPIESGPFCQHCTDSSGNLQKFDERIVRMSQFMKQQNPKISDAAARAQSLLHMATMPAWKDHPEVIKALNAKK